MLEKIVETGVEFMFELNLNNRKRELRGIEEILDYKSICFLFKLTSIEYEVPIIFISTRLNHYNFVQWNFKFQFLQIIIKIEI